MNRVRHMTVVMVMLLVLFATPASAAATPKISYNIGDQNYFTYAKVINSYLIPDGNNGMIRVEYTDDQVIAENYDLNGKMQSQKSIAMELNRFGGFYFDNSCYYLVFGQENDEESNSKEVIRIVKYDVNWNRMGAASVYGANTVDPFHSGSLRMISYGNNLIIRTSHLMYKTDDGYRHQANLTICVDTSSMTVKDIQSAISYIATGYVSHSFNQFVARDGGNLIAVDHGDANPRAIVLCQFPNTMSTGTLSRVNSANILNISGDYGDNTTGASIGGLEVSDSSFLVAGNSVNQSSGADLYSGRNIFLTVTDRNNIGSTSLKWLTSYPSGEDHPHRPGQPPLLADPVLRAAPGAGGKAAGVSGIAPPYG